MEPELLVETLTRRTHLASIERAREQNQYNFTDLSTQLKS